MEALSRDYVPMKKKRERDEVYSMLVGEKTDAGLSVQLLKPSHVARGHTAYLTFARRCMPPEDSNETKEE